MIRFEAPVVAQGYLSHVEAFWGKFFESLEA